MQDVVVLTKKEADKIETALVAALAIIRGEEQPKKTKRKKRATAEKTATASEQPAATSEPERQTPPPAPTKRRARASADKPDEAPATGVGKLENFPTLSTSTQQELI